MLEKTCECVGGYCNEIECNLCDIKACYYNIFVIKLHQFELVYLSLFFIVILFIIFIILAIKLNGGER